MPACRLWTDSVLRAGGRAPFVRIGLLMNSKCLYGLKLELRSHWAFKAGGRGHAAGQVNLKYGQEPGVQFYTHICSR